VRSVNLRDEVNETHLHVDKGSTCSCVQVIVTCHVILLGGVEVFIVFDFLHWRCHVVTIP
jgi:hypothetical protein